MLKVTDLSKYYGALEVLRSIDIDVSKNEIVGLVGPSGCGKTTALNIISGHDVSYQGQVRNDFSKISYVFQEDRLMPWCTVSENIKVVNDALTQNELDHLLETMELFEFSSGYPDELSGGMRQRVSIARAFAYKGDLLLMDEPFKSLDQKIKESLIRSLITLYEESDLAVLLVTHDLSEAAILCDRIVFMTARPSTVAGIALNTGSKVDRLNDKVLLASSIKSIQKTIEEQ